MALGLLGTGLVESVQTWGPSHQALSSLQHRASVVHVFSSLEDLRIKSMGLFVIIPPGRNIDEQGKAYLETSDFSSPETLGLIHISLSLMSCNFITVLSLSHFINHHELGSSQILWVACIAIQSSEICKHNNPLR